MIRLESMLRIPFRPSVLYLIRKERLAHALFLTGMFIAYIGSLRPWMLWPLGRYYIIPSALCLALAYYVGGRETRVFFSRTDYIVPLTTCVILYFYMLVVNGGNVNGVVGSLFKIYIFLMLMMVRRDYLFHLTTRIAQVMACFLMLSITAFVFYLIGFPLPLPSWDTQYNDGQYFYTNYFLFMVDDRSLWLLIPRFSSVFLEPGHIGTAAALLLFTQMGHWKRWWNVVLVITVLISFSLAAYVIFFSIIFFSLWIKGRHVVRKALWAIVVTAVVVTGSFFYNEGDNMLHNLIVLRLEINEEGTLEGDNRVKDWFESEYESFLHSPDIWLGRNKGEEDLQGNTGYRVYIYDYGLVGLALIIIFYMSAMMKAESRRVWISVMLVAVACFYVRSHSLYYNVFIPLYVTANMPLRFITGASGDGDGKQCGSAQAKS